MRSIINLHPSILFNFRIPCICGFDIVFYSTGHFFSSLNLTIVMKKLFTICIIAIALSACNSGNKPAATTVAADTTVYPYKATYSSAFTCSDNTKNAVAVLQSYKDWEDNKLSNGTAYLADTIYLNTWTGDKALLTRDSAINLWQKYRDSLSSSKIEVVAWDNLHSTDKNEDWVSVWYKQTDTYKTGKVDSAFYQDDNKIANGKINFISTKKQNLKK